MWKNLTDYKNFRTKKYSTGLPGTINVTRVSWEYFKQFVAMEGDLDNMAPYVVLSVAEDAGEDEKLSLAQDV